MNRFTRGHHVLMTAFTTLSAAAMLTACSGGGNSGGAMEPQLPASQPRTHSQSNSAQRTLLSSGTAEPLPAATVCLSVRSLVQAANTSITHTHLASGFVYGLVGTATLIFYNGLPAASIGPGQAGPFTPSNLLHTHANQTANPITWEFIGVRPGGTCAVDVPPAVNVFAGADISGLPSGDYAQKLERVDMSPGASTAHHAGALVLLFVTQGSVIAQREGQAAQRLNVGQGIEETPNTIGREVNGSSSAAQFLQYTLTHT